MDISTTIEPRSDQQNYDDVASVPRTVTVAEVRKGSAEQPVEIHLVEFPGRPYKPCKTMRRVLIAAWGPDASKYAGRRMTLFGDASVRFGGLATGGIRISHLSDMPKRLTLAVTVSRGKRAPYIVEPLTEATEQAEGLITPEQLKKLWPLLTEAGLTDAEQALRWMGKTVQRDKNNPLTETKKLTAAEADRIFAELDKAIGGEA